MGSGKTAIVIVTTAGQVIVATTSGVHTAMLKAVNVHVTMVGREHIATTSFATMVVNHTPIMAVSPVHAAMVGREHIATTSCASTMDIYTTTMTIIIVRASTVGRAPIVKAFFASTGSRKMASVLVMLPTPALTVTVRVLLFTGNMFLIVFSFDLVRNSCYVKPTWIQFKCFQKCPIYIFSLNHVGYFTCIKDLSSTILFCSTYYIDDDHHNSIYYYNNATNTGYNGPNNTNTSTYM